MDEAAPPSDRLVGGKRKEKRKKEERPPAGNSEERQIQRGKKNKKGIESKDVKEVEKITRAISFHRYFSLLFDRMNGY